MINASHFVEILPDRELKGFLLHQVLQPLLDSQAERGLRLAPAVIFRRGGTSHAGPAYEVKGKCIPCRVNFCCRRHSTLPELLQYVLQVLPETETVETCLTPFQIEGTVRRDVRGYYQTGTAIRKDLSK
jgi:hypothetical protein